MTFGLLDVALYSVSLWFCWSMAQLALDISRGYSMRKGLKGPVLLPLIGHMYDVLQYDRMYHLWLSYVPKYGRTYFLKYPFMTPWVMVTTPASLEHVHKTAAHKYKKSGVFVDILGALLGDGIFAVDDEKWRVQRKLASNIFTVKNFRDFFLDIFWTEIANVVDVVSRASETGEVVDLFKLFHVYTLQSFAKIGFGLDLHLFDPQSPAHEFANAFDEAQRITDFRFYNPFWKYTEPFTGEARRFEHCQNIMHKFTAKVIADRRLNGCEAGEDLLCRFMEQPFYNDQQLHDIVLNMIIAGRDTTAQALSWAIYELIRHPECVQKIRDEIKQVKSSDEKSNDFRFSGLKGSSLSLSYSDVTGMKYTRAVISETLRLYPSVPKQAKTCVEDDILPDGSLVEKGSWLCFSSWVNGRLEEIWGPDASEFKPERFLDNDNQPSHFKFSSFNAGHRLCLGINMAYMEASLALVVLLNHFDFELCEPDRVEYMQGLTLQMKHGLKVRAKRVPKVVGN